MRAAVFGRVFILPGRRSFVGRNGRRFVEPADAGTDQRAAVAYARSAVADGRDRRITLVIAGLAVAYLMRGRDDNAGDKFKTAGALPEQITNSNSENAPDSTPPTRPRPDQ